MRRHDLSLWTIPPSEKKPSSLQLEQFMIAVIQSRAVQPGECIPSHRVLAAANNVNRNTALRAYTRLITMGWLTHNQGSGARVALRLPSDKKDLPTVDVIPVKPIVPIRSKSAPLLPGLINFFSVGTNQIIGCYSLAKVLGKNPFKESESNITGPNLDKLVLAHLQTRGFNVQLDNLVVVRGRAESLRGLFSLIAGPGDTVLNSSPYDKLVTQAIGSCGARMIGLDVEDPEFLSKLEELLQKFAVTVLYISPACTFPKCMQVDDACCEKLLMLARRYEFTILEEEDEHELWWDKQPFMPLALRNHMGHVIYSGAISRVSPYLQHLRTVIGPSQLIAVLKGMPELKFGYMDILEERAVFLLLSSGELLMLSRKLRLAKRSEMSKLEEILVLQLNGIINFTPPSAGTGFWIEFPRTNDLEYMLDQIGQSDSRLNHVYIKYNPGKSANSIRFDFSEFDQQAIYLLFSKIRSFVKTKRNLSSAFGNLKIMIL